MIRPTAFRVKLHPTYNPLQPSQREIRCCWLDDAIELLSEDERKRILSIEFQMLHSGQWACFANSDIREALERLSQESP